MSNHNGDHESSGIPAEQLTAYALGQLHGDELAAVKAQLSAAGNESALREVRALQATAAVLSASRHAEPLPGPSPALRELVEQRLLETAPKETAVPMVALPEVRRSAWRSVAIPIAVCGTVCCALLALVGLPLVQNSREAARRTQAVNSLR